MTICFDGIYWSFRVKRLEEIRVMPEANDKKKHENQHPDAGRTMKMPLNAADVEVTQKIDVDLAEVIENDTKTNIHIYDIKAKDANVTDTLAGKSIFVRKRVTDDYVKSSTLLSTINSIPPLEDDLKLQAVDENYELKQKFSEGSQGIIRTAFDKSLKRDIVVKSLKTDESEERSRQDENLFVSEARIMAQLDHPSIIPLYGLHSGSENKLHLAMKHIHGKTLQDYLRSIVALYEREGVENFDEKRSIATRIEYLIKVCEAVDYAHRKGVVHRDLKPENIMIGNYGEVYVMDWGLACLVKPDEASDAESLSEAGERPKNELVGTPCYIAPELIRGGKYTPQSDIFSLGMILFEIVTLQRAVPGKTIHDVLKNIIDWNYRPFKHRFLQGSLPADLEAIIGKAICEPPSRRYKTAGEMASDLKLYLMNEETTARPDNLFRKCMRAMINHKMITSTIIMSILLCLAASTIYSLYSQNKLMRAQEEREEMLTFFQSEVAERANRMERIFFYFKTQLANVAYIAGRVFSIKVDANDRVYRMTDFLKSSTAPPDYRYSPAYGIKVSLDYAVFKTVRGGNPMDMANRKVVGIQTMFKHIMFTSDNKFLDKSEDSIKRIIFSSGAPLRWVFIGLENGTMFSYPGKVYAKNYDPRKRPWYKNALKKQGITWSEPYEDAASSRAVITCTQCVFDENNKFQGMAGMDVSLYYIQQNLFNTHAEPLTKEYLLNGKGRVVLSSDFKDTKAKISRKNINLRLVEFPFLKELSDALMHEKVQFEAIRNNRKYIFALNRVPALNYYYVEQVSETELKKYWKKIKHKAQ